MEVTRTKSITHTIIEVHIIMALVLLAFFLLITLLDNAFPKGTTLGQFMSEAGVFRNTSTTKKNMTLAIETSNQIDKTTETSTIPSVVAKIKFITKVVKSKQAGKLTWKRANIGRQLYNQDAVQTFSDSNVRILFDNKSYIDMDENSLIIIKKLGREPANPTRHARLILSTGRFFSMLAGTKTSPMAMEVTTGDTITNIISTDPDIPAGFNVKINPDKSSTITIVEGSAIILSEGESVEVNENEAVSITTGKALSTPVAPPGPISIISPSINAEFTYHEVPRQINFSWHQKQNIDSYNIQIAKDKNFRNLVTNENINNSFFASNNLIKGKYYWRVRGNIGWIQGHFSKTYVITVEQDVKPPELAVNLPPDITNDSTFTITGSTDASMKLFINERPIAILADGSFSHTVTLQQGSNLVIIEAMDKAGNVNYQSKIVNFVGKKNHDK